MNTKNYLFFTTVAILLFMCQSCTKKFYQVYDVETVNLKCENKKILFENNDCEIIYNFWGKSGNLSFIFKNKTDEDIYIDMTRSFFIRNGFAYNYYNEKEYTSSIAGSVTTFASSALSLQQYAYELPFWIPTTITRSGQITAGNSINHSKSITTKESKQICVPAKSAKCIAGFKISDYVYLDCDNKKFNMPSKAPNTLTYTESNTPLNFRNRIVYCFADNDNTDGITIDNNFWVKSLTNYRYSDIIVKGTSKGCLQKAQSIPYKYMKHKAANRFYNTYEVTQ